MRVYWNFWCPVWALKLSWTLKPVNPRQEVQRQCCTGKGASSNAFQIGGKPLQKTVSISNLNNHKQLLRKKIQKVSKIFLVVFFFFSKSSGKMIP
jgi:hypothetical protein